MSSKLIGVFEWLHISFAAVYALLERPSAARRSVVLLLAVQTALIAYSAYVHSPTLNEPGHLVAGLSYWKFGRFDVYNVNPPLAKMVAAIPVIAVGYEEDWSGFYTGLGARPEFSMGEDFVTANGERSFFLFMIARWACIPFAWLGGVICYLWARDLYGRPAGVIASALWCFEPNILAHTSLITSDAAGTALGLAACYTFWRWLRQPTWSQAALNGVVLGLAELTKTTLILLYPLWPLMWVVYRWRDRHSMGVRDWLSEAGMLVARMLIGLYVLNLGYGFEGSLEPLGEFKFVSNLFTGQSASSSLPPNGKGENNPTVKSTAKPPAPNRFTDSFLVALPVPLPRNYLLGIDLQQKDFEHHGRPSYLRGEWRDRGWWYYYLYASAIKVPLGLWVIGALALMMSAIRRNTPPTPHAAVSGFSPPSTHCILRSSSRDLFVLLLPAVIIFVIASAKTGINEHMRYILPVFPYFYIWISRFCLTMAGRAYNRATSIKSSLMPAALCWVVVSSLFTYPHSLSYFNEAIGGPLNGHEHLCGSNVDWGQDLRYLSKLLDGGGRAPLYVHVRLVGDPRILGVKCDHVVDWRTGRDELGRNLSSALQRAIAEHSGVYYATGMSECDSWHRAPTISELWRRRKRVANCAYTGQVFYLQ